jgi:hypothetical protein
MSVSFAGLTPNNQPTNTRTVLDNNYIVSVALPNAANTVNTAALDLFGGPINTAAPATFPYPTTEFVNVIVATGLATGANSLNINCVLQHTNALANGVVDTSNWVNIAEFAAPLLVVAGNATKYPAASITVKLSPTVRRYIRAQATGEANGGNASDANLTLELGF